MDIKKLAQSVADTALSPMERVRFLNLCEDRSSGGLQRDRDRVQAHLRLLEGANTVNPDLDLLLAGRIGGTLLSLLHDGEDCTPAERALLAGAVEYFIMTGDSDDDLGSPVGLEDDARVTSAVAHALGRDDLEIEL